MTNRLNETEITIIETCLNYDDRESQLSDNYSNGDLEAFARALPELTARQLGSLMTSMQQRGLITEPDPESDGIVWLTEDGVNAYFDHMEAAPAASIQINTAAEYEALNQLYARLEIDRDRAARDGYQVIVEVINEQRAAIVRAFRDYADRNA